MENEHSLIHEFDFSILCEYFSGLERQGPGSPEMTLRALSFIDNLTDLSQIADLGCGTGGQTMVLAQNAPGNVTGIDLFPGFIDLFNANATKLQLQSRVHGLVGSMDDLPFQPESLDLIWCEGAIYNIGFEHGLHDWSPYLREGGHVAVTEACWLTDERPAEIETFWNDAYPQIDTIPVKLAQLQTAGYQPIAVFALPSTCWSENFFKPQKPLQEVFLQKHPDNLTALNLVAEMRKEASMYEKYGAYYGYVFFIGRKG
jgi:SAM-dependent methyltransferase